MNYSLGMAEIEGFQELKEIEPDVIAIHRWDERSEVCIFEMVKNEANRARGGISDHILELYDVGVTVESFEYFNFPLHLALLHWLQNFDHNILVGVGIDASVHFRVFAFANFGDNLIVFNVAV